jgi:hypothetical protein|tara:strand:+ start:49 stop:246 length:198 start_codon:yes stop_codon:yes gene_type:complete
MQMQKQNKKTWVKPTSIIIDIGKCRYCNKDMTNQESFVAFADKTKAHYQCMKEDDNQRALDKTYE